MSGNLSDGPARISCTHFGVVYMTNLMALLYWKLSPSVCFTREVAEFTYFSMFIL